MERRSTVTGVLALALVSVVSMWALNASGLPFGRIAVVAAALLSFTCVATRFAGSERLAWLLFTCGTSWALTWATLGLIGRAVLDIAAAPVLPSFGVLFGVVGGTIFGLASFWRSGAVPEGLGTGALLGLTSSSLFLLLTLVSQAAQGRLLRSDSDTMIVFLSVTYLVFGTLTGIGSTIVAGASRAKKRAQSP